MNKQDNQRDIDAILRDCSINYIEQISPIYQGNPIRVHIEGKGFFKQYDDRGIFEETPPEKIIVIIDKDLDHDKNAYPPENYHPLTTETQKQEVIALLKKNRDIHEGKQLTQQKAIEDLRAFCRNLHLVLPTDTSCDSCDFTVNDLHNYLRQCLCKIDNVKWLDMQIDGIILNAINLLINNRNFLIGGQQGQKEREQINYERYRRERKNVFKLLLIDSIYSGYLTINACKSNGVTETWEWQNITFNKAQIKQVFPLGGEEDLLLETKDEAHQAGQEPAPATGGGRVVVAQQEQPRKTKEAILNNRIKDFLRDKIKEGEPIYNNQSFQNEIKAKLGLKSFPAYNTVKRAIKEVEAEQMLAEGEANESALVAL